MKLNRQFLRILAKRKQGTVGEIIEEMGFLEIKEHSIQNLHREYRKFEDVCKTVYLLDKHGLIKFVPNPSDEISNAPDFNFANFNDDDGYAYERLEYIAELKRNYWPGKLKITPEFYSFSDNQFRLDSEKKEQLQFWFAVGLALLSAFFTAVFTSLIRSC